MDRSGGALVCKLPRKMEKRTIGKTGVTVSSVGIGGWQMGGPEAEGEASVGHGWGGVDDRESVRLVHEAQELGINLIDTADIYGNGHSEEVIGQALQERREAWVLATKGGLVKAEGRRGQEENLSAPHLRRACEASLRRLRTDCIDFYQLHADPRNDAEADEVAAVLKDLKNSGKIRFSGISTDRLETVERLFLRGVVDVVQLSTNLFQNHHEVLAFCHSHGIGTFIRTPLDWGATFAKYAEMPPRFEKGDWRADWDATAIQQHNRKGLKYAFLWEDTGRSPAQAALRAVLDKPGVTAVIPGTRKLSHLLDNAGAAGVAPLSDVERQRVWTINEEAAQTST